MGNIKTGKNLIKKTALLIILLLALICVAANVWASADVPGSESDPVVTKSYVDQKLASVSSAVFTPMEIKQGQSITGGEGTELILRSGEASVIGGLANGISDLTGGTDLISGAAISTNHLLLIPRSDGRGIIAATDIWVMIKGSYELSEFRSETEF